MKTKINNLKKKKAKEGNCFEKAFQMLMNLWGCKNVRLVHGVAVGTGGKIKGKKHYHAWLEINDVVIDLSNNKKTVISKHDYYRFGSITNVYKYTVKQAMKLATNSGHYGKWETKLINLKNVI